VGEAALGQGVAQRPPALAVGAPGSNDPSVGVAWVDTAGILHFAHGQPPFEVVPVDVVLGQPGASSWTDPALAWGDGAFYLAWTEDRPGTNLVSLIRIPGDTLVVSTPVKVASMPQAAEPAVAVDQAQTHVAVAWVAAANGAQQVHVQRFLLDLTTP